MGDNMAGKLQKSKEMLKIAAYFCEGGKAIDL